MLTLEMAGERLPASPSHCTSDPLDVAERSSCAPLLILSRLFFSLALPKLSILPHRLLWYGLQVIQVFNTWGLFAGIQPTVWLEPWQLQYCM